MNILKSLVVLLLSGMIYSQSMLGPHEDGIKSYMIIGYKIVPSLDDGYGCWSELDIMQHQSIPKSTRDKITKHIINYELNEGVLEMIEIKGVGYHVIKMPNDVYYDVGLNVKT